MLGVEPAGMLNVIPLRDKEIATIGGTRVILTQQKRKRSPAGRTGAEATSHGVPNILQKRRKTDNAASRNPGKTREEKHGRLIMRRETTIRKIENPEIIGTIDSRNQIKAITNESRDEISGPSRHPRAMPKTSNRTSNTTNTTLLYPKNSSVPSPNA